MEFIKNEIKQFPFTKSEFILKNNVNESDIIQRVERIVLKPSNELSRLCHISKNLYNKANYIIRWQFFNRGSWCRYGDLDLIMKESQNYRSLPIHTSQQILKVLDKNWVSFFNGMKEWKKKPSKFLGMPKVPKYKKKDGEFLLIFDNFQVKINKDGIIRFPKNAERLNELNIKTRVKNEMLNQIRIIPRGINYVLEVVYTKVKNDLRLNKKNIIGIDLGMDNLVTIGNNIGVKPIVIKGLIVKSINQYYNKMKGKLQSIRDLQKYKHETKRMQRLTNRRYWKLHDYFHKTSKKVIQWCVKNDIGKIVIGYNEQWKQDVNKGKQFNQKFVQIPYYKLVQQIQYKAEEFGIETVLTEESYTSKCSFLDNEYCGYLAVFKGKRLNRGLYQSSDGRIINAHLNGALNIIKKVVPDAFSVDGIEDVVLHPVRELVK